MAVMHRTPATGKGLLCGANKGATTRDDAEVTCKRCLQSICRRDRKTKPAPLANGKTYDFTFKNGNTLRYTVLNKDSHNGRMLYVKNKQGHDFWIPNTAIVKYKEVTGSVYL